MANARIRANEAQKNNEPTRPSGHESVRQQVPRTMQQVAPDAAYRRTQVNRIGLRPADFLTLQRTVGNRMVQRTTAQLMVNADDQSQPVYTKRRPEIAASPKLTVIQRIVRDSGTAKKPKPPYWSSHEDGMDDKKFFDDYDAAADYDVELGKQRAAKTAERIKAEQAATAKAKLEAQAAKEIAEQEAYIAAGEEDPLVEILPSARNHYKHHNPANEPGESWLHDDEELKAYVIDSYFTEDAAQKGDGTWEIYFGQRSVWQKGGGFEPKGCNILMTSGRDLEGRWWASVFHFGPTVEAG